jgi:DNA-binding Lrp family transcriptional regulator
VLKKAGLPTVPRRLAAFDELDRRLIGCLFEAPYQGFQEAARRLGIARGTVQARLERLLAAGVITRLGPYVNPKALGYTVESFTVFEVEQESRRDLFARLAAVPNVLEAHIVTGPGDILCRLAATDNDDLRAVIDTILDIPGVRRASTRISLTEAIPYRVEPLLAAAARAAEH